VSQSAQTPDDTEVTQAIDNLLQAKDNPDQSSYAPGKIEQLRKAKKTNFRASSGSLGK
jgi:hypothetical protein